MLLNGKCSHPIDYDGKVHSFYLNFQEMLRHKEKMLMERLQQSFRRAESQLISILEHRKGEVKVGNDFKKWEIMFKLKVSLYQ